MKGFIILNNFDVNGFTEDHHVFEDNTVTIRHVKLESSHDPVFPPEPLYTSWVPGNMILAKCYLFFTQMLLHIDLPLPALPVMMTNKQAYPKQANPQTGLFKTNAIVLAWVFSQSSIFFGNPKSSYLE
jgi:hypothetical protein